MKKRIVTISREFGSGGRLVGRQVAERLGVPYYDRELIAKIAAKSGLDPSYITEYGEYATSTSRFLYNWEMHAGFPGAGLPVPDELFVIQYNVITELAEKEECVLVGRCADYILRDRRDCLHAFLHAAPAFRADRIVRIYGEAGEHPEKRILDTDAKRKVYYEYYTNRTWGMAQNYHVALNSGDVGLEKCVDVVVELAKG